MFVFVDINYQVFSRRWYLLPPWLQMKRKFIIIKVKMKGFFFFPVILRKWGWLSVRAQRWTHFSSKTNNLDPTGCLKSKRILPPTWSACRFVFELRKAVTQSELPFMCFHRYWVNQSAQMCIMQSVSANLSNCLLSIKGEGENTSCDYVVILGVCHT